MKALAIVALFVVTACDAPRLRTEAEIEAIAHDTAVDATAGRMADMERKIADLERELERLDSREDRMTEAAIKDLEGLNKRLDSLTSEYRQHVH